MKFFGASRALVCGLALTLGALPIVEKICDLACAAPAQPRIAEQPVPHCHPAPRPDTTSAAPEEGEHPCNHSHQVEGLLSVGAAAKAGLRPDLAPAVLSGPNRMRFGDILLVGFDRLQPSESPPLRSSRSVLRL